MASDAQDIIRWRGVTTDKRTAALVEHAEKLAGFKVQISQGSYKASGGGTQVAASGSTHDAGGVLDIRTANLTEAQRKKIIRALKDSGAAAWFRDSRDGMSPHIHMIDVANRRLPASARRQVASYDAGRNGLTNNAKDRGTYRATPAVKFNYPKRKPVPR